jgi:hypothetical protein
MDYLLIHISEFALWVTNGTLKINIQRIIFIKDEDDSESYLRLLDAFDNVRISEPEAYLIVRLNSNWRGFLSKPQFLFNSTSANLSVESVINFQALTSDSQIRLRSQTERLNIKLAASNFEKDWLKLQRRTKIWEIKNNGSKFLDLFSFPNNEVPVVTSISDELLESLISPITEYEQQRTLEEQKGMASYGPLELGIRLSLFFDSSWLKEDRYLKFKNLRSEHLNISWDRKSFLDFPEIINALSLFNEDSQNLLGSDPIACTSFFLHKAIFSNLENQLNMKLIHKDANFMFLNGYKQSCFDFLYLLGCSLESSYLSFTRYILSPEKYNFIKSEEKSNKRLYNPIFFQIPHIESSSITIFSSSTDSSLNIESSSTSNLDTTLNKATTLYTESTLAPLSSLNIEPPSNAQLTSKSESSTKIESSTNPELSFNPESNINLEASKDSQSTLESESGTNSELNFSNESKINLEATKDSQLTLNSLNTEMSNSKLTFDPDTNQNFELNSNFQTISVPEFTLSVEEISPIKTESKQAIKSNIRISMIHIK